ncbi:trigger factor [Kytococcus schroeteri]|uniref:trigger factor n=1 Tax=Kytococcus schroeteri TaxID=138300 RepID=UPI0015E88114|nr:trigger factor [Kytococcus schroeteri]
MKSAVENLDPTRVKVAVEVPHEELKPALDEAYKTIAGQVQIPGFRKGKVPARIIDQRFGRGAVVQEAVNAQLPELYARAITENDLQPIGEPQLELTDVPVADGDPLKFTVEVDVRPAIELPDTAGMRVEVAAAEVSEEDVQKRMDDLRERFGTLKGVDRAVATDDHVSMDLRAEIDGDEIDSVEGVSYQVGQGTMIDGLDEALVGMSAGESKTFTAPLAGGDRQGEDSQVTVTVQSVKERELPEVDDEFAQLASPFDTVEELKADLCKQAERNATFQQGIEARDKILEQLLGQLEIPVPAAIVEAEVNSHLEGEGRQDDADHRAEVTKSTEDALRAQFLMDALVERDEVEVEQNELLEYLMMSAQSSGMDPNQFIGMLDQQGQIGAVVEEVRRRKALAAVLETAEIVDTNGKSVDLGALEDDAEGEGDEATEGEEAAEKPAAKKTPAKKATTTRKASAKKAPAKAAEKGDDAAEGEEAAEKPAAKKAPAKKATTTRKAPAKKAAEKADEAPAEETSEEK